MTPPRKVSFIVAGAQKSGTSALDHYLREHPELCLPRR
ncbi:MAG: sulfotransferase, partial [Deltaproteobacteria bacterium]